MFTIPSHGWFMTVFHPHYHRLFHIFPYFSHPKPVPSTDNPLSGASFPQPLPSRQAGDVCPNGHRPRGAAAQGDPTVAGPVGVLGAVEDVLAVGEELGLPVGSGVIDFLGGGIPPI